MWIARIWQFQDRLLEHTKVSFEHLNKLLGIDFSAWALFSILEHSYSFKNNFKRIFSWFETIDSIHTLLFVICLYLNLSRLTYDILVDRSTNLSLQWRVSHYIKWSYVKIKGTKLLVNKLQCIVQTLCQNKKNKIVNEQVTMHNALTITITIKLFFANCFFRQSFFFANHI